MKILLVSFPRYSTDTVNPGEELLKGVLDQDVTPLLLPLSWSRSQIALENKIAEIHPDAVIVMNLCPYRDLPTQEQYASNKKEWVEPDSDQIYASGEEIEKGGPKNRATSLDLDALSVYLSAQGQRSSRSFDGGYFLDNQAYYLSLGRCPNSLLFHLPKPEELPLSEQKEALEILLNFLRS